MSRKKYPKNENSFGGRLNLYRESINYNIIEFSKLLNISQGSLSDIENNKAKPSYGPINELIQKTDINIYWLFTGNGEMRDTNRYREVSEESYSDNPKAKQLTEAVLKILQSKNPLAVNALENCIKYFDQTVNIEKRINYLENKIKELK